MSARGTTVDVTWGDDEEPQWSDRFPSERFGGGVPLDTGRTSGARWFR